jgi:hypothetical protein
MARLVPIVDYLVLDGEPHLAANECEGCGARYFDRRNGCANAECEGGGFSRVVVSSVGTIPPRSLRRLLLHFDDSIQGRIPEILGDDREERVQTLVRLLDATTTQDMDELLEALQEALARLAEDDGRRRIRRLRREG